MEEKEAGTNPERLGELFQACRHEILPDEGRRVDADKAENIHLEKLEDDWKQIPQLAKMQLGWQIREKATGEAPIWIITRPSSKGKTGSQYNGKFAAGHASAKSTIWYSGLFWMSMICCLDTVL